MRTSLLTLLASLGCVANATFSISKTLGDNMVLQRDRPAMLYGLADDGTVVKTTFKGKEYASEPAAHGTWRIKLDPSPASGPFSFAFTDGSTSTSLSNVLFGDVYICGGQSNMQWSLPGDKAVTEEVAKADNYSHIRLFTVGQGTSSDNVTLSDLKTIEQSWSVAGKTTIVDTNGDAFGYFSAVCWIFGRTIADSLGNEVPIGLISNNWGGTRVEQWSDVPAFQRCGRTSPSGNLYNAMIAPYLVGPMSVTGFTWYQGEANTADEASANDYACLFPSMITSWRTLFNNPEAYFGFIQLSTWCVANDPIPLLREAQMKALALSNVGYATNADHGAGCDIHPNTKSFCATRLGNSALSIVYKKPINWRSPSYGSSKVVAPGTVSVSLRDLPPKSTLKLVYPVNQGTLDCTAPANAGVCGWANVEFDGKTLVNATVSLGTDGRTVLLTAVPPSATSKVTASSYGYAAVPMMSVYLNDADLPLLAWKQPVTTQHIRGSVEVAEI